MEPFSSYKRAHVTHQRAQRVNTLRHAQNRKYITYRNVAGGEPSHSRRLGLPLKRRCNTLRFVDDVIFPIIGPMAA